MWSRWDTLCQKLQGTDPPEDYINRGSRLQDAMARFEIPFEDAVRYNDIFSEAPVQPLADYNELALREFLDLAQQHGVEVWLLKTPTFEDTFACRKTVWNIAQEYDCVTFCDDFSLKMPEIGLEEMDFLDQGHMNLRGATKTTIYFAQLAEERLGWKRKSSVFYYTGDSAELLPSGDIWRYTVLNGQEGAWYRFYVYQDDAVIIETDYAQQNYIDFAYDIFADQSYTIQAVMLPEDSPHVGERRPPDALVHTFMKYNENATVTREAFQQPGAETL